MIGQLIIYGLLNGAFYALVALGFSIVWGSMKIVNIAHCVLIVLVSYVTWTLFGSFGVDPLISTVIMLPLMFIVGIIIYRSLVVRFYKSRRYEEVSTVATFGLALALQNVLLLIYGPHHKGIDLSYKANVIIGGVRMSNIKLVAATLAMITTYIVYLIITKSYFGKAVRATWQDETAASFHGISVNHVRMITFGLASSTMAMAGTLVPVLYVAYPHLHWTFLVYTFLVVVIGGVGSIIGTTVAGLMVGLIEAVCVSFMPVAWIPCVLYGLFIFLLFVRPTGLFRGHK